MTIDNLIVSLNTLFTALDTLYNINAGGCCHTACIVAKEFEKRNFNNFSLRIYNDYILNEEDCLKNIENDIDEFPIHSCTANHYVLVYDNIEINPSTKLEAIEDLEYIDLYNVDSNFISDICNKGDWNCMFNRNNLTFIRRFNKIIFDQYDKKNKKH